MSPPAVLHQQIAHLYDSHHNWLYGWLYRKLGHRGDANDLAQDTFLRLWTGTKSDGMAELREPRAYLVTIAKRLLINHLERQSLERAYLASLHLLPEPTAPSLEERAILLETLRELDALLDGLPPRARSAFLMSQLDGMNYEDIAKQLQVSVRTVTRYMAQGFEQCLKLMMSQP